MEEERELPRAGSLLKWPQEPRIDQTKAFTSVCPTGSRWQGPRHLNRIPLLFPASRQGTRLKLELLSLKPALLGNVSEAGSGFTWPRTTLTPASSFLKKEVLFLTLKKHCNRES